MYNLFDELDIPNVWGDYTSYEKLVVEDWEERLGKSVDCSIFRDAAFLDEFLEVVPEEEQFKYVENTINYALRDNYDSNYVLVSRRAVPSDEPKPESFWTDEHREALSGLKQEINGAQRLHSVIMITTLAALERHGLADTLGGASDGEIVIDPNKPFSEFLLMYKPESEIIELEEYLENGGMTREEVLQELARTADDRKRAQGFDNEYLEGTHKLF